MIYFIEDDRSINEAVFYSLKNSGFEVKGFERPSNTWPYSARHYATGRGWFTDTPKIKKQQRNIRPTYYYGNC